jgi:hypothetical protein
MTFTYTDDWVAIVGSREHPDLDVVRNYVRSLPKNALVISGGARGVDSAAVQVAEHWQVYYPREGGCRVETSWGARSCPEVTNIYSLGPRGWPLLRNTFIAAQCHRMVVFPDGSKGGCWDAAREALRFKKPVEVRWCDGRVEPFTGRASRGSSRGS